VEGQIKEKKFFAEEISKQQNIQAAEWLLLTTFNMTRGQMEGDQKDLGNLQPESHKE
jgi:hypothetical protein